MYNPALSGELLRKYLLETMTVTEVAERLGVTCQTLSAVLKTPPGYWLRLQAQRDLWEAEQKPRPKIVPFSVRLELWELNEVR